MRHLDENHDVTHTDTAVLFAMDRVAVEKQHLSWIRLKVQRPDFFLAGKTRQRIDNLRRLRVIDVEIALGKDDDGMMMVSRSGMDCDGVQYSGNTTMIKATRQAYFDFIDEENKWADGPFSVGIVDLDHRDKIKYQSRDLAMEAYEDGHPHVLSSVPYDDDSDY